MKTINYFFAVIAILIITTSCSDNETELVKENIPLVIAFKENNLNFNKLNQENSLKLVFSTTAQENGSVDIIINETAMKYGVDYKTIPEASHGIVKLNFNKGDKGKTLKYINLIPPTSDKHKIKFKISKVDYNNGSTSGFTSLNLSFENSKGGVFLPSIGGATEPNQVFIDFSSKTQKTIKRDSWTLGFINDPDKFNAIINTSIFCFAGAIESTDIKAVKEKDFKELKPLFKIAVTDSDKYTDDLELDFSKNAIAPIGKKTTENKVYLIKLGNEIPTYQPKTGSVSNSGDELGYKKIRILRNNNGYTLQYANINDTTFKEVTIPKSEQGYKFTYFNLVTEKIVKVSPKSTEWDISFTVFTNKLKSREAPNKMLTYGYSDFVYSNSLGGVKIYELEEKEDKIKYTNFSKNNIDASKFTKKRMLPGSSWRDVFKKTVVEGKFYIIKDSDGNNYKLRFLQLTDDKGVRGNTKFEYELLK